MIIYKFTSKTSNKSYIGKTSKTAKNRLNEHYNHALNKNIKTTHFHSALLKYGIDDFEIEILEEDLNITTINEREKYWISYFETLKNGYNMTSGGDGLIDYIKTSEHIDKIRLKNVGKKRSEEQKKNLSISHLNSEYVASKETRNKLSEICKNNESFMKLVVCPFCNKQGRHGSMKKWHFEYCKENPEKIERTKETRPGKILSQSNKMKGHITVIDIRDNSRKNITIEEFNNNTFYISNTKGKQYEKIECPHCNKLVAPQGKRWHFENCKTLTEKL